MSNHLSRRKFLKASAVTTAILAGHARAAQGPSDKRIVRAAIHPAIGVARIGNSTLPGHDMYIGPELVEPPQGSPDIRDAQGALKRQAAQFRIYGYNAAGEVVRELTSAEAEIDWFVHLANKKSEWYRFEVALDSPAARETMVNIRRNAELTGRDRDQLVMNGGEKSISGNRKQGVTFPVRFMNKVDANLGELRTDEAGRLRVLGGLGQSGAAEEGAPVYDPADPTTFNNADKWYDDTADGPVNARVKINGEEIKVDGAWVIVGPPNYAPDVIGWRTLYDLITDVHVDAGLIKIPDVTSFTKDVLPLFKRLSGLSWVNKGFADVYGAGTRYDFADPAVQARLADPSPSGPNAAFRAEVFKRFRFPDSDTGNRRLWPLMYGDDYGTFEDTRDVNFNVTGLRALHLQRWIKGEYVADFRPRARTPRKIENVPLDQQPAMLDQAALHYCLADAFHPGCEVTWPMRHISLYDTSDFKRDDRKVRSFRVKQRPRGTSYETKSDTLTFAIAKSSGALGAQGPGDLTKWMAVPWQGDTVFCRSGYDPEFDPYLLTFWPARVPNHVLSSKNFERAFDPKLSPVERHLAFASRDHWVRALSGDGPTQILQFVKDFWSIGVIQAVMNTTDPTLPRVVYVEKRSPLLDCIDKAKADTPPPVTERPRDLPDPIEQAGWNNREEFESFRNIRKRGKR